MPSDDASHYGPMFETAARRSATPAEPACGKQTGSRGHGLCPPAPVVAREWAGAAVAGGGVGFEFGGGGVQVLRGGVDRGVSHEPLEVLEARAVASHLQGGEGVPEDVGVAELLHAGGAHHRGDDLAQRFGGDAAAVLPGRWVGAARA